MRLTMGRRSLLVTTIAYVALIFFLSSRPYLDTPGPEFDMKDKLAHAIEYGVLGFPLAVAIGTRTVRSRWVALFLVLAIGGTVGAADELLQGTVPGRQMDITDWGADFAGLFLGSVLVLARSRAWQSERNR